MRVLIKATRIEDTGVTESYNQIRLILSNRTLIMHMEKQRSLSGDPTNEEISIINSENDMRDFEAKMNGILNFFDFEEGSMVTFEKLQDGTTEYVVEFRNFFDERIPEFLRYTFTVSMEFFASTAFDYKCVQSLPIQELIEKTASKMMSCLPAKAA